MASSQDINEEGESLVNTGGNYSAMSSESSLADDSLEWQEIVGSKFKPTDQVLAEFYLAGKVSGRTDGPIFKRIHEVNIYKYEPSELSRLAYDFGDGKMYFFTPIHKKYGKGTNIDRIAPGGCWKITGKSSHVTDKDGKPIAKKTSLAYFKSGPESGKAISKTQWLMREYMLLENENQSNENPNMSAADSLTLCVVYFHETKRKRSETEIALKDIENFLLTSDESEDLFSSYLLDDCQLYQPEICESLGSLATMIPLSTTINSADLLNQNKYFNQNRESSANPTETSAVPQPQVFWGF